jgi:hypothetical protein
MVSMELQSLTILFQNGGSVCSGSDVSSVRYILRLFFTDYAHPEAEYTKEAKTMLASIENMKKVHHRSIWKLQNTVQIISQKVRNFSKPIV